MNSRKKVDIGRLIKKKVDEQGISYAEFSRRIHCARTSLYHIFESKSIDIERLLVISEVLHYDFISEVYQHSAFPAAFPRLSAAESHFPVADSHSSSADSHSPSTDSHTFSFSTDSPFPGTNSRFPSAFSDLPFPFPSFPSIFLPLKDGQIDFSGIPDEILDLIRRQLPTK